MKELTDAMKIIKEECKKHIMCTDCTLYDDGCLVEPCPCEWEIKDNACIDEFLKGEEG